MVEVVERYIIKSLTYDFTLAVHADAHLGLPKLDWFKKMPPAL